MILSTAAQKVAFKREEKCFLETFGVLMPALCLAAQWTDWFWIQACGFVSTEESRRCEMQVNASKLDGTVV